MHKFGSNIRVYERANIKPQGISYYLPLMREVSGKYPYIAKEWGVVSFSPDGLFLWSMDTDYTEDVFRKWFFSWLKSKKNRNEFFNKFYLGRKKIISKFLLLKRSDFNNLDNKKLLKIYKEVLDLCFENIIYSEYVIDLFDDFFGKIFLEQLQKNNKNITTEDFSLLTQPATFSTNVEYKKMLLDIILKEKEIDYEKIIDKFGWIKMSWDGSGELTVKEIKNGVRVFKSCNKNRLVSELKDLSGNYKKILKIRSGLRKKYDLSSGIWDKWFELLDNFNIFHDFRKEIQMRANQIIYPILRLIPNKTGVRFEDLMWYLESEVISLLDCGKTVSVGIIAKRKSGWLWRVKSGKVSYFFGKEAQDQLDRLVLSKLKLETKESGEISGSPASRGVVFGEVLIAKSAQEANKNIKNGQILVTSMTTVDFLPSMHKAAAIVTDDGGITCYAAIVSRELRIPCVVGTRVATRLLKNGDKVKVDGNVGLIKKL